ncbi:hypothetical protein J132_09530 [Termitomyces sp. J132]|nr:hypothetical protein J132_09530 [Termitomyces sp. J132]
MPVHVRMDVDEEEEARYEHAYYPGPSQLQGGGQSYARAVVQPLVETYAPQAQMRMGMEVLLGRLEAAGQPVPTTPEFLQDDLAVMVMEGLLNQIKLMRRQRITTLEQIDCTAKRKLPIHKGSSMEPKQAKPQPPQPMEVAREVAPVVACLGVPTWADAAQLLFMLPITVPAPAVQFKVVVVATDPRTPVQYDGLMAEAAKTLAASKGKTKAVPTEEDSSDYGQSSEEEEEEEEEGETPAQRFQHVQ